MIINMFVPNDTPSKYTGRLGDSVGKRLTSAQVTMSPLVSSSPASGSLPVGTEPASDPLSPSVSAPPPLALSLSPSLKINKLNTHAHTRTHTHTHARARARCKNF